MDTETIEIRGHIIDSLLLPKILDHIVKHGAEFVIESLEVGQRRENQSYARIEIKAPDQASLAEILGLIRLHGASLINEQDCQLAEVDREGVCPEGFYVTSNQPTFVRLKGRWVEVERPEMDCAVRVDPERDSAGCLPMAELKIGDLVVVGHGGTRVAPVERPAQAQDFAFMGSEVSTEKPKGAVSQGVAQWLREARSNRERILVVTGPAVVHTGAVPHLVNLIEAGYVDLLFAGNALAVHDIEYALFGTSLGVYLDQGRPARQGHENHMRAINTIRRLGGIKAAVERGVLKSGVMHACVRRGIPFVLAGSIRDDGPLPDVVTDAVEAQVLMRRHIQAGVGLALMLATTLHSVAVGNLLPATVRTVSVDINPSAVTKLTDRGSFQALGVVTDVEPFLREVCGRLGL